MPIHTQAAMSGASRESGKKTIVPAPLWHVPALAALLLFIGVEIYGPALHGQFVFDDLTLPFTLSSGYEQPLASWLSGVRPTLMSSYWVNYWYSGLDTFAYHFTNLIIHVLSACFVFLLVSKILELAGTGVRERRDLAAFSTAVFFVHPLQAESVGYVAGRSECLSGLFTLAAWSVFLYRRERAISWKRSLLVLFLFGLAVGAKEQAATLVPLLLLTDYFWGGSSFLITLRANWRIYSALAAGTVPALAFIAATLRHSPSAGFGIARLTWYQYFLTECRAIPQYIRLFLLPIGQTIDHDFPFSNTIFSHGALFYLAGLIASVALTFVFRKKYPLTCFGFLVFLILLAPTSSVIPILDPFVEHRMYLPVLGLLFVAADVLRRRQTSTLPWRITMISVLLLACVATFRQAEIWSSPWLVWTNAIKASPRKTRPYSSLVETAIHEHHCAEVAPYFERASAFMSGDVFFLMSWAKVLECTGKLERALQKVQQASSIAPTSAAFEMMGLLYGEMGKLGFAKQALDQAIAVDPSSATAISARGIWFFEQAHYEAAAADFRASLLLNPRDFSIRHYLWLAENELQKTAADHPAKSPSSY